MDTATPSHRSAAVFRAAGLVVAAVLLLLTWQEGSRRAAGAAHVDELVQSTGLERRSPGVAQRARLEPDPFWGRLTVARALVAEAVDPAPFATLPSREAALELARVSERLDLASELAAAAAAERPAVWQAPMLLGATAYLQASRRRAGDLATGRSRWVEPLRRAAELAPSYPEPHRFLAAVDLESWPLLTVRERVEARQTLAVAFRDDRTFSRLIGAWFGVAADREDAFALVPDRPASWRIVQGWSARSGDWETSCAAADRCDAALATSIEATLADIEARLSGGDRSGARAAVLDLLAVAPPDRRRTAAVTRALEVCPPGPATSSSTRGFGPWLRWTLDGFVRGHTLLPDGAVDRLLHGTSGLDTPDRALSLLAAGRLVEAEALDRHVEDRNTERWAAYNLAKARVLAERGERDGARASLELVHPARRHLPEAGRFAEMLGVDWTVPRPAAAWAATAWTWRGGTAWLDVVPDGAAPALQIEIVSAPARGAIAEVDVGFSRAWRGPVHPGDTVSVPLGTVESTASLTVTFRTAAGGRITPGATRLVKADQGES